MGSLPKPSRRSTPGPATKRFMPVKDPALRRERQREYQRKWYAQHANRIQQNRAVKRCRDNNEAWLAAMKSKPCTDCGNTYPPECMDYDHLPQHEKTTEVSAMVHNTFSRRRILEEIAKCELVCSNCHRVRTKARRHV